MERERVNIFLSFSNDEFEWVDRNVYRPLVAARLASEPRAPRIFRDREGIAPADDFHQTIAYHVDTCLVFLAVWSSSYSQSAECMNELTGALRRKPPPPVVILRRTRDTPLSPLVQKIQAIDSETVPRWFDVLCNALGVIASPGHRRIRFAGFPPSAAVGHTLPPVTVEIVDEHGAIATGADDVISLRGRYGGLHGSRELKAERGLVRYTDLFFDPPARREELIASGPGLDDAQATVTVCEVPHEPVRPNAASIPAHGDTVFFDGDGPVVVRQAQTLSLYDLQGKRILELKDVFAPGSALRLATRCAGCVVLASWDGVVAAVDAQGRSTIVRLDQSRGLSVVAGVAIAEESIYVATWAGEVLRAELGRKAVPDCLFHHDGGIQAVAVLAGRLVFCDFAGRLFVRDHGADHRLPYELEERIHALEVVDRQVPQLIAIGEARAYVMPADLATMAPGHLPLATASAALGSSPYPVAVDDTGQGIRLDAELNVDSVFRVHPRAVPVSADQAGRYCVLRGIRGDHVLVEKHPHNIQASIVYSHASGVLALSPDGAKLAVGDGKRIAIVSSEAVTR